MGVTQDGFPFASHGVLIPPHSARASGLALDRERCTSIRSAHTLSRFVPSPRGATGPLSAAPCSFRRTPLGCTPPERVYRPQAFRCGCRGGVVWIGAGDEARGRVVPDPKNLLQRHVEFVDGRLQLLVALLGIHRPHIGLRRTGTTQLCLELREGLSEGPLILCAQPVAFHQRADGRGKPVHERRYIFGHVAFARPIHRLRGCSWGCTAGSATTGYRFGASHAGLVIRSALLSIAGHTHGIAGLRTQRGLNRHRRIRCAQSDRFGPPPRRPPRTSGSNIHGPYCFGGTFPDLRRVLHGPLSTGRPASLNRVAHAHKPSPRRPANIINSETMLSNRARKLRECIRTIQRCLQPFR